MPMELLHISFPTPDGLVLHGLHYQPAQSKRVLIYLHGNGHSSIFTKSFLLLILAELLEEIECGLIAFNNRGAQALQKIKRTNGEDVIIGSALETIDQAPLDIEGAITYALKQGYEEIFLYGHSSGANKVVVASAQEKLSEIKGVILSGAGDDTGIWYKALGEEKFHEAIATAQARIEEGRGAELISPHVSHDILSFQALKDVLDPDGQYNCFPLSEASGAIKISHKPLFLALKTLTLPTLVIYGADDPYCVIPPKEAAQIIAKNHGDPDNVSSAVIEGADHSFSGREKKLSQAIQHWVKEQITLP